MKHQVESCTVKDPDPRGVFRCFLVKVAVGSGLWLGLHQYHV
jgi:hypothetical protein